MNPASVDIKDILVVETSLGLTFKTNLFIGKEPATPDATVTIFDTPGQPNELLLVGKSELTYEYPAIQIRVRNLAYLTGWAFAESIKTFLHGLSGQVKNNAKYDLIECIQGPFLLDWDERDRVRIVLTFNITRKSA